MTSCDGRVALQLTIGLNKLAIERAGDSYACTSRPLDQALAEYEWHRDLPEIF